MADIEIYTRAWCPYCAKAKALLQAKGLAYTEIDISDDSERQREMVERTGRRTTPQVLIDGESVGGYDELASLNASGELARRLDLSPTPLRRIYDVAVIGAGPAGMTAAIYAARKNLSTVIVAMDIGGQVGTARDIANYPAFNLITGPDLAGRLYEQLARYNVEQVIGERIVSLELMGQSKVMMTASGREICARAVVIASGVQKRHLDIPGESRLAGRGVVYCSTCDGPLFAGLDIAIVGAGNSGLQAALEMSRIARNVYLLSRGDWHGDAILQDKLLSLENVEVIRGVQPIEIHGKDSVDGLTVRDIATGSERRLEVRGVFIEIGLYPNAEFVLDLLETNERGEILVDSRSRTGVKGVYAAGDVTDMQDKQIVIALGTGAKAALAAAEYIATLV